MSGRTYACLVFALTSLLTVAPNADADASCPTAGDAAVVCEINAERRARERRPLTLDPALELAARRHARDMVRRGYFSHLSATGETMVDRLREVGYIGRRRAWTVGELLAWGTGELGAPAATVDAWMRSRSHRRVLLGRDYREIGVGVADGNPYGPSGSTYAAELGSG